MGAECCVVRQQQQQEPGIRWGSESNRFKTIAMLSELRTRRRNSSFHFRKYVLSLALQVRGPCNYRLADSNKASLFLLICKHAFSAQRRYWWRSTHAVGLLLEVAFEACPSLIVATCIVSAAVMQPRQAAWILQSRRAPFGQPLRRSTLNDPGRISGDSPPCNLGPGGKCRFSS